MVMAWPYRKRSTLRPRTCEKKFLTSPFPYNVPGTVNAVFAGFSASRTESIRGRMDGDDRCCVCGRTDSRANLGAWLAGDQLRAVHLECWLAAYDPSSPQRESRDKDSRRPPQRGKEQAS